MPAREGAELEEYRAARRRPEDGDYRTPAQRDRDRVLYSGAFRRLGGVAQVVAVHETLLVHNRLTHSLKVAQIARRLAERLSRDAGHAGAAGGIDPDVVETAALAHDLGHPPFGHTTENVLQKLLAGGEHGPHVTDSFEGNAQSFRIVTKLAIHSENRVSPALNLTRASLRALLKYPWPKGGYPDNPARMKWGFYASEGADYRHAVGDDEQPATQSAEARIMDWADDIAYAVHDVQDYYRAGLIPLDRLYNSDTEKAAFLAVAVPALEARGLDEGQASSTLERLTSFFPPAPYEGSIGDRAGMHSFASSLITRFVDGFAVSDVGSVEEEAEARRELEVLKQLTFYYVIHRPSLATMQIGERQVIVKLFDVLNDWASDASHDPVEDRRLPQQLRELLTLVRADEEAYASVQGDDQVLQARAVTDYIASLTETQATKLYLRLTGSQVEGSALEVWLRV